MSALQRIQKRGQITVPARIRDEAGIQTGDVVTFRVVGPGRIELNSMPSFSVNDVMLRYPHLGGLDWKTVREEAEQEAADEYVRNLERTSE